jgi:hypothetical protein
MSQQRGKWTVKLLTKLLFERTWTHVFAGCKIWNNVEKYFVKHIFKFHKEIRLSLKQFVGACSCMEKVDKYCNRIPT